MEPCTSFSADQLPQATSLEVLAVAIPDENELSTAQKFLNAIYDEYFDDLAIQNIFKHKGIATPHELSQYFNDEEVETMYQLTNWYHLMCLGYLHSKDDAKHLEDVHKFLGVKNIFDIFASNFEELNLQFYKHKRPSDLFVRFVKEISEALIGTVSAHNATINIEIFSQLDHVEYLASVRPLFEEMSPENLFRWNLFVIIASYFYPELDTSKSFEEQHPAIFALIPKELHGIFTIIESYIKLQKGEEASSKPLIRTYQRPADFVRPDIPGLPNFMKNGGNTCYMSSTLWALAYVIPHKVEECLAKFADNPPETPEIGRARDAFTHFFRRLTSLESETIKGYEVDELRTVLQKAFPLSFTLGSPKIQEDAHEFLNCVVSNLLQMDHGEGVFYISRVFTRVNPEEELVDKELYNYEEALAPYYLKDGNLLSVKLHEQHEKSQSAVTFSDLATPSRQSSEITPREVLLKKVEKEESETTPPEVLQPVDEEKPAKRHVPATLSDQYVLASREQAPEFFISTLGRFAYANNKRTKCNDPVLPSPEISFQIKGEPGKPSEQTVTYNLVAINVHNGLSAERGHYYTYLRYGDEGKIVKYDDLDQYPEVDVPFDQVLQTSTHNGYIFYYKKA